MRIEYRCPMCGKVPPQETVRIGKGRFRHAPRCGAEVDVIRVPSHNEEWFKSCVERELRARGWSMVDIEVIERETGIMTVTAFGHRLCPDSRNVRRWVRVRVPPEVLMNIVKWMISDGALTDREKFVPV